MGPMLGDPGKPLGQQGPRKWRSGSTFHFPLPPVSLLLPFYCSLSSPKGRKPSWRSPLQEFRLVLRSKLKSFLFFTLSRCLSPKWNINICLSVFVVAASFCWNQQQKHTFLCISNGRWEESSSVLKNWWWERCRGISRALPRCPMAGQLPHFDTFISMAARIPARSVIIPVDLAGLKTRYDRNEVKVPNRWCRRSSDTSHNSGRSAETTSRKDRNFPNAYMLRPCSHALAVSPSHPHVFSPPLGFIWSSSRSLTECLQYERERGGSH